MQEPVGGVSHSQRRKNSGEVLGKNAGEWTGKAEIRQEEISGSKRSMCVFWKICGLMTCVQSKYETD